MSKKTINDVAKIASEWWANVLIDPKFDNGEVNLATVLTIADTKDISEGQLEKFKKAVNDYIREELVKLNQADATIILSCDYGPDSTLRHFANQCLIYENNFPWKTTMWIGQDFCTVKYGYSADIKYIYVTEARLMRRIKDAENTVEYYQHKDDHYFDSWSSYTKNQIIEITKKGVVTLKEDLEAYKDGRKSINELRVY